MKKSKGMVDKCWYTQDIDLLLFPEISEASYSVLYIILTTQAQGLKTVKLSTSPN